jgi:hypothetical protein
MPILVYLDQTHIGGMREEQFAELSALVDADTVAVASSDVHVIETTKQASRYRPEFLRRVAALGRGLVLMPENVVVRVEWLSFHGHVRAREAIVVRGPGTWLLWGGGAALPLVEHLDDEAGATVAASVESSFGGVAVNVAALKAIPIDQVRGHVAAELSMLGISHAPHLDDLPATEEGFAAMFPSIGLRRAVYANATTLEPNDIADLSFVCRTVPHFDVVAVDRKMHDRLHQTRKALAPELARHLFHARVVRTVEQVIEAIHELTAERG